MSSSENSIVQAAPEVEVVFERELSSEEPPPDEWSSLVLELPEENVKRLMYTEGLYTPGSGEICGKYIPLSASSVFRHPYYNYPAVVDPGIKQALLNPPPKIIYPDDGQELYLALCDEMILCPIKVFYKQLLEDTVDLKYYGINPSAFRAIAKSLKLNRYVKILDLTDNWIGEDGCFHLGEMFIDNITINTINLSGCRIGPRGAQRLFINLPLNRGLRAMNLSKNQLGDEGMEYLSNVIFKGADVCNINLSYNNITSSSILNLAETLDTHNKLTHLDLSWNSISSANAIFTLCQRLKENRQFEMLDLSWNSLCGQRVGTAIKVLLKNPNVRKIYLTNNKLEGAAITAISAGLLTAVKLEVLDLSYNPLTTADAINLLSRFKEREVKLQRLVMENVTVSEEFLEQMNDILKLRFRRNTVITYGGVKTDFIPTPIDMKHLALNRADAICRLVKKNSPDFALIILELLEEGKEMDSKRFSKAMRSRGVMFDEDLNNLLVNGFLGSCTDKTKNINIVLLADYVKRKWPDKKLPPPERRITVVKEKKKGKKK